MFSLFFYQIYIDCPNSQNLYKLLQQNSKLKIKMISRGQIIEAQFKRSSSYLDKIRKQKYIAHLSRISEIENRVVKNKPREQAKKIQQKIMQLTRLKQSSRDYKSKQQQSQRIKNDFFMLNKISQRIHTETFYDKKLRKTQSSFKQTQRASSYKRMPLLIHQSIVAENKRLAKSIINNSFDEQKFRETLKSQTNNYNKLRSHLRKVKIWDSQSTKKLNTQVQERNIFKSLQNSRMRLNTCQNGQDNDVANINKHLNENKIFNNSSSSITKSHLRKSKIKFLYQHHADSIAQMKNQKKKTTY